MKFSKIRYPNRSERRRAFFSSSVNNWMTSFLNPRRLKTISDNLFNSTPLYDYLAKQKPQT